MGSYAQSDSLTDYETIPEDEKENSNGVSALGDYAVQVLPEWPADDSLLQGNSLAGIEQPTVIPFASRAITSRAITSRAINWRRPGTATDPTSDTAYINGYFSSWNVWSFNPVLNAQQNIQNQAKNIDLILRQSKASFAALELNESLIAQEFYNITDDLRTEVNKFGPHITNLWNSVTSINGKISAIESVNTSQGNSLTSQYNQIQAINTNITDLWTGHTSQANSLTGLNNRTTAIEDNIARIWKQFTIVDGSLSNLVKRADAVDKNITDLWTGHTSQANSLTGLNNRTTAIEDNISRVWKQFTIVDGSLSNLVKRADAVDKNITDLWTGHTSQANSLTGLNNRTTATETNVTKLWESETSQDARLKKIESYNLGDIFDLTVLVTAINAVGTKVQKLVDLFNVDKVLPGTFTFFLQGHIKTQTDVITQALAMVDESLNDNFINYFDDSKNGKFWQAFKKFSDFQMAVFFGVFFETLQEDWEKNWLDILETWNITNDLLLLSNQWLNLINDQLSSANNTLAIITQWLKQIAEKPQMPSIPFDYARLERMLKKLEFGEITNEAGTNLWDFLKSIIDNLGDIITTQLKEFVKVLREILDFLDKLIDKLIGLFVPEDTNFISSGFNGIKVKFNVKFGALLGLADSLKDLFTPTPRDFKQAISFDFLGAKFEPDFSMIDPYVKKFRVVMSLSLWMSVVVFIFRKITGTGDLVNDN